MKRFEMPRNMSFGTNGLDWMRSVRKITTQLRFMNVRIHGTSSAHFALTFM
jgi:hypothetical protein